MAKIDKSKWDTSIRVSQKTIDEIKKMGMKQALGTVAGATKAAKTDPSAKAWAEGVKRLYGSSRVSATIKATAPKGALGSAKTTPTPKKKPAVKKSTGSNTVRSSSRPFK